MTQEGKELLLKDLCARLPYGVKCVYFNTENEIKVGELRTIWCKEKRIFIDKLSIDYDGCDCIGVIPYLFPLSSMTDEELDKLGYELVELELKSLSDEIDHSVPATYEIDYYNSHHIDYRGLIEKGLAIDCTNLNIY